MTEQQIYKWAALLPGQAAAGGSPEGSPQLGELSVMSWLNDPAFGWHFALFFFQSGRPFPFQAVSGPLIQAYRHLAGAEDADIAMALSIHECDERHTAAVIESLLLCPKVGLEEIARWVGVGPRVARLYHELWFNVRERLDNLAYIARLVYPQGRLAEWGGADHNFAQELRRLAWEKGPQAVQEAAGLGEAAQARKGRAIKSVVSDFRREMLEKALDHVRKGEEGHATVKLSARVIEDAPDLNGKEGRPPPPSDRNYIGEDLARLQAEELERRKINALVAEEEARLQAEGGQKKLAAPATGGKAP